MRGGMRGSEIIPPAYVTTVISGSEMPWENLQNLTMSAFTESSQLILPTLSLGKDNS